MDREHVVHARDLENSQQTGIRRDEREPASGLGDLAAGVRERPHARGVKERAPREVDHGRIGGHGREDILEAMHRCQVELPGHANHNRSPGHHVDLDVKIVRHAHRARV